MKKKAIPMLLTLFFASVSMAHEGHDKSPGTMAAPHGGIVQGTSHIYLELVTKSDGVQVYPFDHEMKPVATKDVKLEGTVALPKKGKAESVKFTTEGDAFVAKVDAKGAHRYSLDLAVTHGGKKEKVKFNVEPQ